MNKRNSVLIPCLFFVVMASFVSLSWSKTPEARQQGALRINPGNARYLVYNNKPFFVIGSGMESHCEPWSKTIPQWHAYLDMLKRNGFNRVRFFLWSFCWAEELLPAFSPWKVLDAKRFNYDLAKFNPQYWKFVNRLLTLARERGIVFEYNLFDYCSLADSHGGLCWTKNPLSALHNNGGAVPGKRGKPAIYDFADYSDLDLFKRPFNPKWTWRKKNQWYQQLYVKHTIDQLASFPNLYWEIMNEQGWGKVEPNGQKWTSHWLAFLDKHDPYHHLRSINAADVYDKMPGMDIVCEHPIPFFHRKELDSPERVVGVVRTALKIGKPVICDETGYFPPQSSTKDPAWRKITREQLSNERRAFWYAFVAGGQWTATCWQNFKERDTHRWVCHFAKFVKMVQYWKLDPHDDLVHGGGAHCLAKPGEQYVVYFGHGGTTVINLQGSSGKKFVGKWFDPRSGRWSNARLKRKGSRVTVIAPTDDDWVFYLALPG